MYAVFDAPIFCTYFTLYFTIYVIPLSAAGDINVRHPSPYANKYTPLKTHTALGFYWLLTTSLTKEQIWIKTNVKQGKNKVNHIVSRSKKSGENIQFSRGVGQFPRDFFGG